MGTFKHCGRLRSARLIGRDLSRFYLQLNEPQKSISFLLDLLRGYQEENWPRLKVDTHVELAEIYLKTGDRDKYINSFYISLKSFLFYFYFILGLLKHRRV